MCQIMSIFDEAEGSDHDLAQWKIYYYSIEIKYFGGDNNILLTFTINKKY